MRELSAIIIAMILFGCAVTSQVTQESVPFTPHPIRDTVYLYRQTGVISGGCDSLIQTVVNELANLNVEQVSAVGDRWRVILTTVRDSSASVSDSLKRRIRYLQRLVVNAQGAEEKVPYLYVKETRVSRPFSETMSIFWGGVAVAVLLVAALVVFLVALLFRLGN